MSEDEFVMCKGWKADTCFHKVKDLDIKIDPELRKKYPDINELILDEDSFLFIKKEIEKAKSVGINLKLALGEE